ncbi:MAG: hypothetical protein R2716_14295 [Microthrixaceae bacterium]
MSGLKLPESQSMTQSRVWLTVWTVPPKEIPSRGQWRTCVPSSRSQRTIEGRMPMSAPPAGSSFTLHRQSRSGSATGCAVESRNGSTPPRGSELPPQVSMWPTSATNSRVSGCSSTGRPASQVAKRRSPHGRGAVFAELAGPKGEEKPVGPVRKSSGCRS